MTPGRCSTDTLARVVSDHNDERLQSQNSRREHPRCYDRFVGRAKGRRLGVRHAASQIGSAYVRLFSSWNQNTPNTDLRGFAPMLQVKNSYRECRPILPPLPKLSLENANKARLLRAKARLAASLHAGAHQGRDSSRPKITPT